MKITLFQWGLLALLALTAGCFSMESAPIQSGSAGALRIRAAGGEPSEHVVIANNGWYLFNAWPLACGNARENSKFIWRFFSNDVNADILQNRLTRYAARKSCDVEELNVFNDEQVFLSIPGTSFPIPIPYVITFRETQISCVLVKSPIAGGAK
ncbi:MAG: hypothetical protein Q4G65_07440 [bacterium]|nr:hypothetical protein [bacterium]